jgi:hypothetical protein
MRWLKLIVFLTIVLVGYDAHSCKCANEPNPASSLSSADMAFTGRIISTEIIDLEKILRTELTTAIYEENPNQHISAKVKKVVIEISGLNKGQWDQQFINIYTAVNGAGCGQYFVVGDCYMVYATNECYIKFLYKSMLNIKSYDNSIFPDNIFWTNHCYANRRLN